LIHSTLNKTIKFTVYGIAQPKGSTKAFTYYDRNQGKYRAATTSDNTKTKPWQELIASAAQEHRPEWGIHDGAVILSAKFYFFRPKSASATKRPYHTVKPDLDKLTRSLGDALKGIIYTDDSRVIRQNVTKDYGDPPRVEIEVELL